MNPTILGSWAQGFLIRFLHYIVEKSPRKTFKAFIPQPPCAFKPPTSYNNDGGGGGFPKIGVPYFGVFITGSYYLGYYIRVPHFRNLQKIKSQKASKLPRSSVRTRLSRRRPRHAAEPPIALRSATRKVFRAILKTLFWFRVLEV